MRIQRVVVDQFLNSRVRHLAQGDVTNVAPMAVPRPNLIDDTEKDMESIISCSNRGIPDVWALFRTRGFPV